MTGALGDGGGGAETTWDAGSVAQPARSAAAPQSASRDVRVPDRTVGGFDFWNGCVFIPPGGP